MTGPTSRDVRPQPGLPRARPDRLVPPEASRVLVVGDGATEVAALRGAGWIGEPDPGRIPSDGAFDAVLLLDVVARVADPEILLRNAAALVPAGGTVVLTAPNARAWPVLKGLLEGIWRATPHGVLTPGHRQLFTRMTLCELVEAAGLRVTAVTGTLTSEPAPKELEAALLGVDLRSAGLAEESAILAHHVVCRRPGPDDPEVEVVAVDGHDVSEALERSRGRVLAVGAEPEEARGLAESLDERTDLAARESAMAFRRHVVFGLGGLGAGYTTATGLVHDLFLRASLGGCTVRQLAPTAELEGSDRETFLSRHGWVRRARRADPVPLVTEAGKRNPAGATLTVAMIVRDEEEALPASLESVKPLADEIVVVDTGSTDRTVEIARSHGARVLHFPWCDDFAAARNAALDAVETEWALVLDADEILTPEAVERIRPALRDESMAAYMLPLVNEGEPTGVSTVYLLRLFRARPSVRFCYRIHEQVAGAVLRFARRNQLGFGRIEGATIRHTGYRPEVVEARGKFERNRRHFEAQLALYPADLYSWYKYADFLREADQPEQVTAAIRHAYDLLMELDPSDLAPLPYGGEIVALRVLDDVNAERFDEAWRASEPVAALDMDSAHAWYARGLAAVRSGHHEEAVEAFRRCRRYEGMVAAVPIDPSAVGPGARIGEAEAQYHLGRPDEAADLYREAVAVDPTSWRAVLGLVSLEGDPDRVLGDLWRRHGETPAANDLRRTGAEALVLAGRPERVSAWLTETGPIDEPGLACALGEAELHAGRFEDAARAFALRPEDPSCRAGALLALALAGGDPTPEPDLAGHVRDYLVNLRRAGGQDLFEAAARACLRTRLLGDTGGTA
jgi:tetratricopeptide (TPR) repeat protein